MIHQATMLHELSIIKENLFIVQEFVDLDL